MRKQAILLMFVMFINCLCHAQKPGPANLRANKCMEAYMQLSRLGPGYSRDISQEIIDQFKSLFARDAFLHWDLYRSVSDSLLPPLPPGEYVDLVRKTYGQKQPVLEYPFLKISLRQDGKFATVALTKINQIRRENDLTLYKNKIKLLVYLNLDKEPPLIQNIVEDKRISLIRSIPLGVNVIVWSNVIHSLANKPVINIAANEEFREFNITTGISVQYGAMLEMRVTKDLKKGLLFSTGIFYSWLPLTTTMTEYSRSFQDTLDRQTSNPFTCTTYERTPIANEKIEITKVEIPLLFKSYINNWIYLKAGTALGFVTVNTDAWYSLSRTGGGWVTNLATQESYYLDQDHELDQAVYGYYRDKNYHFPKDKFIKKTILSIQAAAGFEKQVGYFSFGVEPNFSFGINPLSVRSSPFSYQLNDIKVFHSILESIKMPAFEFEFGIRFLISYVFNN
jgi:hypothetical protein